MNCYETASLAYMNTLREVLDYGFESAPRGKPTLELVNYSCVVIRPDSRPIQTCDKERNAAIEKYTLREFQLFDEGETRAAEFAKHAKLWESCQNPDGTVASAYGHLLWYDRSLVSEYAKHGPLTPWEWCKQALQSDADTRQAVFHICQPRHLWVGTRDVPCTMHGQFRIIRDRLNLTVVMRSNDAARGFTYDMPWFIRVQERMVKELASHYPALSIGYYTHFAHSMHIYSHWIDRARRMIGCSELSENSERPKT